MRSDGDGVTGDFRRADGFLRLMHQRSRCDIFTAAFCDGKESGGSRTLEPKAGDIDFHKLQ